MLCLEQLITNPQRAKKHLHLIDSWEITLINPTIARNIGSMVVIEKYDLFYFLPKSASKLLHNRHIQVPCRKQLHFSTLESVKFLVLIVPGGAKACFKICQS